MKNLNYVLIVCGMLLQVDSLSATHEQLICEPDSLKLIPEEREEYVEDVIFSPAEQLQFSREMLKRKSHLKANLSNLIPIREDEESEI